MHQDNRTLLTCCNVLVKLTPGPTCAEIKGDILSQLPVLVVVTGVVYAVKTIRGTHSDVPAAIVHVRIAF